jgi:hypothetical protein
LRDQTSAIEQTTRPFADDDSRVLCPLGEHPGIDALLVGHRNDQQPDPLRPELIAERADRGKRICGIAFGSAGLALDHVAHTRSIEEPAVTPHNGLLTGVGEEPPLNVLNPRPELIDQRLVSSRALLVPRFRAVGGWRKMSSRGCSAASSKRLNQASARSSRRGRKRKRICTHDDLSARKGT